MKVIKSLKDIIESVRKFTNKNRNIVELFLMLSFIESS